MLSLRNAENQREIHSVSLCLCHPPFSSFQSFIFTHMFNFFPTVYYLFFELLFAKISFQPERLLLVFILDQVCQ